MNIDYSVTALRDLQRINDWIADESFDRAERFIGELIDTCERISDFPEANQVVGSYGGDVVRRKVFGNYLVFYRILPSTVEILRILHGAQDYADLF
jgi:plasmid stabilization system protein ParE